MLEIKKIFDSQQENKASVAACGPNQRKKKIQKLLNNFLSMEEEILSALAEDLGKSKTESLLAELYGVKTEAAFAIKNVGSWMRKKRVSSPLTIAFTKSWVKPEPVGSVLIISPWNYPIMLCLNPLIAAIAAGNTAVIKPSEYTPRSGEVVKKLVNMTFQENEVAVILGEKDVAENLLDQPFNHIMFTGSPRVGKLVMSAAAKHLAGVTLELGGKSPVIINKDANVRDAAWKIAFYKFANAGQTCTAPDFVLCHDSVYDDFLKEIEKNIVEFFSGNISKGSKDYCSIAGADHFDRLKGVLEDSILGGAKVACGGYADRSSLFLSPTVLGDVEEKNPIMDEEIFGPLLPVLRFSDLNKAIDLINNRPKPLALYLFSKSYSVQNMVALSTSSGGFVINDCVIHHTNPHLPFGGINNSGLGSYHGKYGFDSFSHQKAIMKSSSLSPFKLMLPPYSKNKEWLASVIKRFL